MKTQKRSVLRVSLSILCMVAILATMFTGTTLNTSASTLVNLVESFDNGYDENYWIKGTGIDYTADSANGYTDNTDTGIAVQGKAGGSDTFLQNAIMRPVDSPYGHRELEVTFGSINDAEYNTTNSLNRPSGESGFNKYWGGGIVTRATVDANGKITNGYIVVINVCPENWYNSGGNVYLYKVTDGGLNNVSSATLSSNVFKFDTKYKIELKLENVTEGLKLTYTVTACNNGTWNIENAVTNSYTDESPIGSSSAPGKSGMVLRATSNVAPLIDIFSFKDDELLVPSDLVENFDNGYDENYWIKGTGIDYTADSANGYTDSTDTGIAVQGKAGGSDTFLQNAIMRPVDSPYGDRELEVTFGSINDAEYNTTNSLGRPSGESGFNKYWGGGIVTRATVAADGKITNGYIVVINVCPNNWYSSGGNVYLYKVTDGGLSNVSSATLSSNVFTFNTKYKIELKLENVTEGLKLTYTVTACNNGTWNIENAVTNSYTDKSPIGSSSAPGKSGMVLRATSTVAPLIDIFSFKDEEHIVIEPVVPGEASDLVDTFDRDTLGDDWMTTPGITNSALGGGTKYADDNAVKLHAGCSTKDDITSNLLLRENASPAGDRFIETTFGGNYRAYVISGKQETLLQRWGVGLVANAVVDTVGDLKSGYIIYASLNESATGLEYYSSPVSVKIYKVEDYGSPVQIGETVSIPNLDVLEKVGKLQLAVNEEEGSTTLSWNILDKNAAGDWQIKYSGSYTDNAPLAGNGRSGVTISSYNTAVSEFAVDIYDFSDVTPTVPTIATAELPDVEMSQEYFQTIALTQAVPQAVKYSITAGELPFGLFFDQLTGEIYGVPLIDCNVSITVTVEDTFGNTDSKAYEFTVTTTNELAAIEIKKYLLGFEDINMFRVIDKNGVEAVDICDLVWLDEQ